MRLPYGPVAAAAVLTVCVWTTGYGAEKPMEPKSYSFPAADELVDTGPAWRKQMDDSVVFGVQGDLHSDRVKEADMQRIYADLPKVGADFVALCGDVVGFHNGLREAKNARRPVLHGFGDHECFEEWGYIWCDENLPYTKSAVQVPAARRRTGTVGWHQEHPFNMMLTEMPPTEAWSGLPYWWSMTYQGIHFVVIGGFKCQPVPSFYLEWFRKDLEENRDRTTVIFTHRIVFEKGNKWDNLGKWDEIVKANPQVRLILYGHYHYAPEPEQKPFDRIGNALALAVDLVSGIPKGRKADDEMHEIGAYALTAVNRDGIRVYMRFLDRPTPDGSAVLVHHEAFESSYDPSAPTSFSLPYVMTAGSRHYAPAIQMQDTQLRVWGVEREQMLPNPVFAEPGMPFAAGDGVRLEPMAEPNPLDIPKMLKLSVAKAEGSEAEPAVLAAITMDLAEKGKTERWNTGTGEWDMGEYMYDVLAIAKGEKGRRVWVVVETLNTDGSIEGRYVRKMTLSGRQNAHYIYQGLGVGWNRSTKTWIWTPGPRGKEDQWIVEKQPRTRESTQVRICLTTPDRVAAPEEIFASVFVYTTEGFYTVPTVGRADDNPSGRDWTRDIEVEFGGKRFGERQTLRDGQCATYELGDVLGGTEFGVVNCGGSRLALVEIKGRAPALMRHQIRRIVKQPDGSFSAGPVCEGADSNNPAKGVTKIDFFGSAEFNGKPVRPKMDGSHADLKEGDAIRLGE